MIVGTVLSCCKLVVVIYEVSVISFTDNLFPPRISPALTVKIIGCRFTNFAVCVLLLHYIIWFDIQPALFQQVGLFGS